MILPQYIYVRDTNAQKFIEMTDTRLNSLDKYVLQNILVYLWTISLALTNAIHIPIFPNSSEILCSPVTVQRVSNTKERLQQPINYTLFTYPAKKTKYVHVLAF